MKLFQIILTLIILCSASFKANGQIKLDSATQKQLCIEIIKNSKEIFNLLKEKKGEYQVDKLFFLIVDDSITGKKTKHSYSEQISYKKDTLWFCDEPTIFFCMPYTYLCPISLSQNDEVYVFHFKIVYYKSRVEINYNAEFKKVNNKWKLQRLNKTI